MIPNFRLFADNEQKTTHIMYSYYLSYLVYHIAQEKREEKIEKFVQTLNQIQGENYDIRKYPKRLKDNKILREYSGN